MTTTEPWGRWSVTAHTKAGHVVRLAESLDEESAQQLYDGYVVALNRHLSPVANSITSDLIEGHGAVVRLDAVEAIRLRYDLAAGL